ncbi:hypothetical protein ARMGADRAFT_887506, partial [Armillaria gallica]
YGSPDSLISEDNVFLHVSNFSDAPVVISKGQKLGIAHNPRNWLDRYEGREDTESKHSHALLIKELIKAGSNTASRMIRSTSEITSKAQRNACDPDDPAASEPIEGGPKTADSPPDALPSSEILDALDISPNLTQDQRRRLQEVILKNQQAFGLDGRLGTNDARVEIKLKPGATPVSLPPFPMSPANREVM